MSKHVRDNPPRLDKAVRYMLTFFAAEAGLLFEVGAFFAGAFLVADVLALDVAVVPVAVYSSVEVNQCLSFERRCRDSALPSLLRHA